MDERTENTLTTVSYISLFFILTYLLIQNLKNPWVAVSLSGLLIISSTVRRAVIYGSNKFHNTGKILIIADMIIIFFITIFDKGSSSTIFYFVLLSDCILEYSYKFSGTITLLCYVSYSAGKYIWMGFPPLFSFLTDTAFYSLAYISITAIVFIVKYQIMQSNKLRETMHELKVKSRQLENTLVKLRKTSEDLEEMTILQERNRIAREIHDTVGHTLTTVLLEMEAGERLIKIDPGLAAEKIRLAKGQVRKGLNDIRQSVRTLQSGREIMEFVPSLKLLIEDTKKHSGIYIKDDIDELPKLTESQEKAIYRALQEGLTNGIRHGKSSAFVFRLKYENGIIKFLLQDNGEGSDKISKGFGLSAMEERVKELGGILNITSKSGEGCAINIAIPVGKEDMDGFDKSIDSR